MSDPIPSAPAAPRPSRRKRIARVLERVRTLPIRHRLEALARVYGTDKGALDPAGGPGHGYVPRYQQELGPRRRRVRTVLEIGIGGYADPYQGGASLRMWKDFFPRATVVGIDLHDKSRHAERRLRVFQGDQTDAAFLARVVAEVGPPDVVIDDGSHVSAHVIATFRILFPHVTPAGLYFVEDLHTSYDPAFSGAPPGTTDILTSMRYFQALTDDLHAAREADPLAASIAPMTF